MIAWHEHDELIVKQIYPDKVLFSQQTTCLNYGKISTRQAGRVRGQPNSPVFFPTRIGERASANHAHCFRFKGMYLPV